MASQRATKSGHGAAAFLPTDARPSLKTLREASQGCRGCELYKHATQAVFGQGPAHAEMMLVGEQPGDREDIQGEPFVGPAGDLLNKALDEAGIDRKRVYLTNAVKHFKWTPAPRGKRRLHAKPTVREVKACHPWLEQEVRLVKPRVVVCLGATAAQSLLGAAFRVTKMRGRPIRDTEWAEAVIATVHPSSVLRAPDEAARRDAYAAFVQDLRAAAAELAAD